MTRWANMNGNPEPDSTNIFKIPPEGKHGVGFSGGSCVESSTSLGTNANPKSSVNGGAPIPLPAPTSALCQANGGNSSFLNKPDITRLSSPVSSTSAHSSTGWNNSLASPCTPGDVGLTNLGNTCFLNSGLQCLLHSGRLVEHFLNCKLLEMGSSVQTGALSLFEAFKIVTEQVWCGQFNSIPLNDFRTVLGGLHPQFKDGRQHDCQEFLALTLDTLHEQLKNNRKSQQTKSKSLSDSEGEPTSKKIKVDENAEIFDEKVSASNGHVFSRDNSKSPVKTSDDMSTPSIEIKTNGESNLRQLKEKVDDYWDKHMEENNTVISSTFQGIYKSTVVCSECSFVSRTYEPFMYLSLPIPRLTTKDLIVQFVSMKNAPSLDPTPLRITMNLTDTVEKLEEEALKQVSRQGFRQSDYFVAEVYNNMISKRLDTHDCVRDINNSCRNIYMYELNDNFNNDEYNSCAESGFLDSYTENMPSTTHLRAELSKTDLGEEEDWDAPEDINPLSPVVEVHEVSSSVTLGCDPDPNSTFISAEQEPSSLNDTIVENNDDNKSDVTCCICLEGDIIMDFRKHVSCGCVVCTECIQRSAEHYAGSKDSKGSDYMTCPRCMKVIEHEKEYVPITTDLGTFQSRMHLIVILFRCDSDTNNNSASSRIFGTPYVVRIPNSVPVVQFNTFISNLSPLQNCEYKIEVVNREGNGCGYCMYTEHCHGCELVNRDGVYYFNNIMTLALCFSNISDEDINLIEPVEMMKGSPPSQLYSSALWLNSNAVEPQVDIHECLATFSESENLDDQNPWFCPSCKKNQCATKTINICKFPDYLIVYLKRFIFDNNASVKLNNKLAFPLANLDLKPYISEECADSECFFDLYACVCHYGSASAGHYTAYGKNPVTQNWNHFNDNSVTKSTPSESDYQSAYVLFYQKKGVFHHIPRPEAIQLSLMHNPNRITDIVPYTKNSSLCVPTSTTMVNGHDSQVDSTEEGKFTSSISKAKTPYLTSCDIVRRHLKLNESNEKASCIEEIGDEDQENHMPSSTMNGHGDFIPGAHKLTLGRKDKRPAHQMSNGGPGGDPIDS